MFVKSKIKPENRIQLIYALGPLAWLALVLGIFLWRLENPNLDFITGFLIGFSIVGNLGYIYVTTRYLRKNRE
jgi:hypothetical protein